MLSWIGRIRAQTWRSLGPISEGYEGWLVGGLETLLGFVCAHCKSISMLIKWNKIGNSFVAFLSSVTYKTFVFQATIETFNRNRKKKNTANNTKLTFWKSPILSSRLACNSYKKPSSTLFSRAFWVDYLLLFPVQVFMGRSSTRALFCSVCQEW